MRTLVTPSVIVFDPTSCQAEKSFFFFFFCTILGIYDVHATLKQYPTYMSTSTSSPVGSEVDCLRNCVWQFNVRLKTLKHTINLISGWVGRGLKMKGSEAKNLDSVKEFLIIVLQALSWRPRSSHQIPLPQTQKASFLPAQHFGNLL